MSRSEPKPKIIYKNLEEVIKSSSLHKKAQKTQNFLMTTLNTSSSTAEGQKILQESSHHPQTQKNQRFFTEIPLKAIENRENVQEPFKFIQKTQKGHEKSQKWTPKPQIHQSTPKTPEDPENPSNPKKLLEHPQKFPEQYQKVPSQMHSNMCCPLYKQSYNEIDAVFTELEDFLCEQKERILNHTKRILESSMSSEKKQMEIEEKVDDMMKMGEYIKCITKFFVDGEVPQKENIDFTENNEIVKHKENSEKFLNFQKPACQKNRQFFTEILEENVEKTEFLSSKISKSRTKTRAQHIGNRKKTVYEMILEEREKGKNSMAELKGLKNVDFI